MTFISKILRFLVFLLGAACFCITCLVSLYYIFPEMVLADYPYEIAGTDAFACLEAELTGTFSSAIVFIIFSLPVIIVLLILSDKLRSHKKVELNFKAPFILYLRSFADDDITKKAIDPIFSGGRSEEEGLVDVLSDIAPVIAIGNPKQEKYPFGAARFAVAESEWKNKVLELAQDAKLIVLRLGATENFWWEVENCLEKFDKSKLLFIIPAAKKFNDAVRLATTMAQYGINISEIGLSINGAKRGTISSFLFVNKDGKWQAKTVKYPKFTGYAISYRQVLRNALDDFFVRFGFKPQHTHSIRVARLATLLIPLIGIMFAAHSCFNATVVLKTSHFPKDMIQQFEQNEHLSPVLENLSDIQKLNAINKTSSAGLIRLPDDSFLQFRILQIIMILNASEREVELADANPQNPIIIAKKHLLPEYYNQWCQLMTEAAVAEVRKTAVADCSEQVVKEELAEFEKFVSQHDAAELDDREFVVQTIKFFLNLRRNGFNSGRLLKHLTLKESK